MIWPLVVAVVLAGIYVAWDVSLVGTDERDEVGLRQRLCGMRGHHEVLHFEEERMTMRCTSCQHDSPGWEIPR